MTTDRTAKYKSIVTPQYANEAFEYKDGVLFWKERPLHHFLDANCQRVFNSRQAGTAAGSETSGYLMVRFKFGKVAVHRLVYLMHHGIYPAVVDHIDGNIKNNRIENLRAATHQQNIANMKTPTANTSGVKGVSFHKATGKWAAYIRENGKMRHLGTFSDINAAANVRRQEAQRIYGEFSNGR